MARWENMKGDLGLKSKHYRQRLEAIQSVSSHFEDAPFDASISHESFLRFSIEMLDILLFTLALSDSNLEVHAFLFNLNFFSLSDTSHIHLNAKSNGTSSVLTKPLFIYLFIIAHILLA